MDLLLNEKAEKFKSSIYIMYNNRTLEDFVLTAFAPIYNRYEPDDINKALSEFAEKQQKNKYKDLPTPKQLKYLIVWNIKQEEIASYECSGDCKYCANSGHVYLVWGGNILSEKYNWITHDNPEGMRVIKNPEPWAYTNLTQFSCLCDYGRKQNAKKRDCEDFDKAHKWVEWGCSFKIPSDADQLAAECVKLYKQAKEAAVALT